MLSGKICFLRYVVRTMALIAAGALGAPGFAQNTQSQQQNQATPPPGYEDPMGLPPRTTAAPVTAQEPETTPGQPSISPQSPNSEDQGRFVFKKQVQEVVLHATVVDETGHMVTGLDRSAFTVYQNGQPETITSFRREDVPVALGIVIDNSGSMRDKRARVNRAVMNLIRASNPEDEVFLVNFGQVPYLTEVH